MGLPDLEELKTRAQEAQVDGAFVRVRWNVPEEERGSMDRPAIEAVLAGAAEVKLEGRVIPVVRTRAAGISQEASIAGKVRAWAKATEADATPLLMRKLSTTLRHLFREISVVLSLSLVRAGVG